MSKATAAVWQLRTLFRRLQTGWYFSVPKQTVCRCPRRGSDRLRIAVSRVRGENVSRVRCTSERLEDRRLLAGVTVVTHGYQGGIDWVNQMANAIATQAGGTSSVTQYTLTITNADTGTVRVGSLNFDGGHHIQSSPPGEIVIKVDWRAVDGGLPQSPTTTTGVIARLVTDALSNPASQPTQTGLFLPTDFSFTQLPIHLIGHSRGGSVVTDVARRLGAHGVWVDHITTLDPRPVNGDAHSPDDDANSGYASWTVPLFSNVVFGDNYFRVSTGAFPFGTGVTGGANDDLSQRVTGAGTGTAHEMVHTYYHATVDPSTAGPIDGVPIGSSWFNPPPRASTGYAYSRIVQAKGSAPVRPIQGLRSGFGGNAFRHLVTRDSSPNSQRPNVGYLAKQESGTSFPLGSVLHINYKLQDFDSASDVLLYLDVDRNPYNNNFAPADPAQPLASFDPLDRGYRGHNATQDSILSGTVELFTGGQVETGRDYYVCAKIQDGTNKRFAYLPEPIQFDTPPADTTAPTAQISTSLNVITAGGTGYAFSVRYADNAAVDVSTFGNSDIRVTGPNGYSQLATFLYPDFTTNGTPRTATYRITPPGGTWDSGDNGAYAVVMQANQVGDTSGRFVAAQTLHTFQVNIRTQATLASLAISGPASVAENGSGQYAATATFSDGSMQVVTPTWTISSGPATINPDGLLTAGTVDADTTAIISASYTSGGVTRSTQKSVAIVNASTGETRDLITNGGFESGQTGWTFGGTTGVYSNYPGHTGTRYALLGESPSTIDTMFQDVTVDADASSAVLSYWYNITSQDTGAQARDLFGVWVRALPNGPFVLLDARSNLNRTQLPTTYTQGSFDVSSYRGQTIRVMFTGETDATLRTSFRVDDVSLRVTRPPPVTLQSVYIGGPATINENTSADYTATAFFSDGSSRGVTPTWSTSSGAASISSGGRLSVGPISGNTAVEVLASYSEGGVTRAASKAVTIVDVPVQNPALYVSATTFDVGAGSTGTTFVVYNSGTGTLNWTASTSDAWLSLLTPSGSSTGPGDQNLFQFQAQANTAATSRSGRITISATGAAGSPVVVTITQAATVNRAPGLASLAANPDPVVRGNTLSLTPGGVTDPDGNLAGVHFYRETNNQAGLQVGGDTHLTLASTAPFGATIPTAALAPGTYTYYARAIDSLGVASNVVSTMSVVNVPPDTTPPTADIVDVAPDPRQTAVGAVAIIFSEPISGFNLADLTLTRDGGSNLLSASQTLTSADNITWSLGNLAGLTTTPGSYVLTLRSTGSAIGDAAGNTLSVDAVDSWIVQPPPPPTTVLQPGPSDGRDVWLTNIYNDGGLDNHELRVGGWGDLYYSLLAFNLTGMPATAQSATLHLYARGNPGASRTAMTLHRVTSAWDEGTKWSGQPSVVQVGSLAAPSEAPGWYTIDVTTLYNGWQAGTLANHGIQLRPTSNNNNFNEFHSSDFAGDPSLRPKLVITTPQPPPAAPTVTVNDGSGNQTFVRRLTVAFNESGITAAEGAFVLTRRGGGRVNLTVTPGPTDGPSTFILTFSGPETVDGGALINGVYDLRVVAGLVRDGSGQAMAADFAEEFFVLRGDINRDRSVNGTDFALLAANFGKTGMTYAQGDLNGDGSVNGTDFAILAGNFGRTVPPPLATAVVVTSNLSTASAPATPVAGPATASAEPPQATGRAQPERRVVKRKQGRRPAAKALAADLRLDRSGRIRPPATG